MRVINIIEVDTSNNVGLLSVRTFGIPDEDVIGNEEVDKVEDFFIEMVLECETDENTSEDDKNNIRELANNALEDGFWESGTYTIFFSWSEIGNIQL